MSRCRSLPGILLAAALLAPHHRAVAQGTVLDRVRKATQDAANAGRKAATDEVNRQINSAVLDAAAEDVADGSFEAVLSPWSIDNTRSVQVARYAGNAFVVTTPTGRQVIICDPKGVLPWQTTFTISNAAVGTPTNKALGTGKSITATTTGRGGGATSMTASTGRGGGAATTTAPSGRGAGAATTGTGRSGGASSTGGKGAGAKSSSSSGSESPGRGGGAGPKTAPALSADEKEYKIPSPLITIALPTSGPKIGAPSTGSVIVANVSQEVLGGAVKIRFAQASIPGEKGPQVVDFGVAFKAMVLAAGTMPSGCLAPGGAKATVAGRGATPRATMPGTRGGGAGAAAAATPGAAASTTPAFAEGDVLIPKIDNVKLLAAANDSGTVTTTLRVTDQVVYLGEEQNGYVHVQGSNGEGWARKALLKKK